MVKTNRIPTGGRANRPGEPGVNQAARPEASPYRAGFTLIEVLSSMAILLILMLALMRMFEEATAAFKKGTTSVTRSAAARAAMDMITRDLSGAVIDRRFQFYKEANTVDRNFDECYFVTMEGDPNDSRSYQVVRYYVDIKTNTYAGVKSRNFRLMRGTASAKTVMNNTGIDIMSLNKRYGWWDEINRANFPFGAWDSVHVADNVARFDLYVHDENGHLLGNHTGWKAGASAYDTGRTNTLDKAPYDYFGDYPGYEESNTPPAFVDVYLQVASEDAMRRAGLDLIAADTGGGADLRTEGISILYRESILLVSRIHPTMAGAEIAHPSTY